jgi:predicted metal-dependent phosphoesterase TrpH
MAAPVQTPRGSSYQQSTSNSWQLMLDALEGQQAARRERVHLIAERLGPLGAAFDPAALVEKHAGTTIGRPHIASELVRVASGMRAANVPE